MLFAVNNEAINTTFNIITNSVIARTLFINACQYQITDENIPASQFSPLSFLPNNDELLVAPAMTTSQEWIFLWIIRGLMNVNNKDLFNRVLHAAFGSRVGDSIRAVLKTGGHTNQTPSSVVVHYL